MNERRDIVPISCIILQEQAWSVFQKRIEMGCVDRLILQCNLILVKSHPWCILLTVNVV